MPDQKALSIPEKLEEISRQIISGRDSNDLTGNEALTFQLAHLCAEIEYKKLIEIQKQTDHMLRFAEATEMNGKIMRRLG